MIEVAVKSKSRRGFASMDPNRQREIASEGGRAAHQKGTAHEFTSDEARSAGRKGGIARAAGRQPMAAAPPPQIPQQPQVQL
jgi:general stress protein YciG